MNSKKTFLFALMAVSIVFNLAAQQITEAVRKIDYQIRDTADYNGNRYISYWGQHPSVLTFVNSDGSVTVCASNTSKSNSRKDGHAGHPKIIETDNGRYLILWELFSFSTQTANTIGWGTSSYLSTVYALESE